VAAPVCGKFKANCFSAVMLPLTRAMILKVQTNSERALHFTKNGTDCSNRRPEKPHTLTFRTRTTGQLNWKSVHPLLNPQTSRSGSCHIRYRRGNGCLYSCTRCVAVRCVVNKNKRCSSSGLCAAVILKLFLTLMIRW